MNYLEASEKLHSFGQQHLLQFWESLSEQEKDHLLHQIAALDIPTFHLQNNLLRQQPKPFKNLKPFLDFSEKENPDDRELGLQILADGRVGCILIAGGQGTRLNLNGPKGMFPVTQIKNKTLFQLFAEKVAAASRQAQTVLPLAIMTSPLNHEATVAFFKEHNNFGLYPDQIEFFTQDMLPMLSPEGNLFLEKPNLIAEGPDGNGLSLRYFVNHKIWQKWRRKGIDYCMYILIDNALADPFDAELVGHHHRHKADITVKCIERMNAEEKVGVLVNKDDKAAVLEYTEIPDVEKNARNADGRLKHRCANMSNFCLSMDFLWEAAKIPLPLHQNMKSAKSIDNPNNYKAWKFETFIFDILPYAISVKALLAKRENAFSPLKNASGDQSLQTVQADLQKQAISTFEKITGQKVPANRVFELAQEFYYPTPSLLQKWKGKSLPDSDYVTP